MSNDLINGGNSASLLRRSICSIATILLSVLGGLAPSIRADADTLHYWRFEIAPGFTADSAGFSALVGGGTQTAVPASGPGSAFPHYFSVPGGGPNTSAAAFHGSEALSTTIAPITSNFTVEAFVHLNSAEGPFGKCIVCSTTNSASIAETSFALEVRLDQVYGSQIGELVLATSDGASLAFVNSGFVLGTGTDYYVASAFDLSGNASFWVQDLTNGGVLQSTSKAHGATSLNSIASLAIGGDGAGAKFGFELDGLIDEVRLSNTVLDESQLLINNTTPVPLPSAIWFLVTGIASMLGCMRRTRNKM
ncbi:LamG-like jellyroll fold domain-containing protein [Methylococcus sp. EFPC2]|uniref:LamG-like jellyroll fold domain-containing protein n=1 Tax=Methylococcus sp. EFPC2 TaxID=2812648 RepID=UPI0019687C5E|nr:LamG-like jellyroll fold domain-containing protein [Methylococcus sp. EFPC2]QSA97349.1 hypothetical protein JWZ97_00395 [Methylococcus sp. EFPC2]